MPLLLQPAARASQAKRLPALDVHVPVGRGHHPKISSPGARRDKPHMYYNDGSDHGYESSPVVTTPTVAANLQVSTVGDTPTPSTGSSTTPLSDSVLLTSSDIILSSSSSSPLSTSTSTTTTVTSSMVLQSPVSTAAVSGGVTSPVPADSVVTGAGDAKGSSAPSGGVIAAVVVVLLLAMGAVAFFVNRRYRIQKRVARRATWTPKLAPQPFDLSLEKGVDHGPAVTSDTRIETASQSSEEKGGGNGQEKPVLAVRNITRKPPLPYSPVSPIAPFPSQSQISNPQINIPDADADADADAGAGAGARAPSMDSANVSTASSTPVPEVPAFVRMTFVPQLPDELAITPGETLHIQTEFDDGWAMCVNRLGRQGMVPLECLEVGEGEFGGRSQLGARRSAVPRQASPRRAGSGRTSPRRASSLNPATG